ncbi:MAG: hypothetical protein BA066_05855 [Candidatus Korarchaeota archaeon NZ13-K]|nr:MAG: hypothetical protein BA066_05855 [Candidatus Korarchaeota archaeon NZ13-K]
MVEDFSAAVKFMLEMFLELASWIHRLLSSILVPIMGMLGITGATAETLAFIIELMIFVLLMEKAAGIIKWVLFILLVMLILGAIYTML